MIFRRSRLVRFLFGVTFLVSFDSPSAGAQDISPAAHDRALVFDGVVSSSAVVVPFHPMMNAYARTRQLTIEAWVKPGRIDTVGPIVQKSVGLCKDDWVLTGSDTLSVAFIAPNSCRGDGGFLEVPRVLRLNVWQHVAGVWDGESLHVYVDGVRRGVSAFGGSTSTNQIGVSIGSSNHWDGTYSVFKGLIDDVRYSVTARYRGLFVPRIGWEPDSSTVFQFDFNDGRIDTLVDIGPLGLRAPGKNVALSADAPGASLRPLQRDSSTIALFSFDGPDLPVPVGRGHQRALRPGRFGKALALSNRHDAVQFQPRVSPSAGLTVDCWVNVERLPERGYIELATQMREGKPGGFLWTLRIDSSGVPEFGIADGISLPFVLRSPQPLSAGWHHVAGVWLGKNGSQALFVDAACVTSTLKSLNRLGEGSGAVVIGRVDEGERVSFRMDEVRIADSAHTPPSFGVVVPPIELTTAVVPEGVSISFIRRPPYPRSYRYRVTRLVAGEPDVDVAIIDTMRVVDTSAPEGRVSYVATAIDILGFESFRSDPVFLDVPGKKGSFWILPVLVVCSLLAASVLAYLRIRSRRGAGAARQNVEGAERPGASSPSGTSTAFPPDSAGLSAFPPAAPIPDFLVAAKPGIYVFGPMLVVNSAGEDITYRFSGKVRQLLQLLILRGSAPHGGVRSEELSATIWPEEDLRNVKNSRNVLISRLRDALEGLRGAEVVYENGKWGFTCIGEAVCDFYEIWPYLSSANHDDPGGSAVILRILGRGPLLQDESYPWLDPIRAEVHDRVVKLLLRMSGSADSPATAETRLSMADTVLLFEPLSEDALRLKVGLLTEAGRHAAARIAYDAFAREYQDIIGRPFPIPFSEIERSA